MAKTKKIGKKAVLGLFAGLLVFISYFMIKDGITEIIKIQQYTPTQTILFGFGVLSIVVVTGWVSLSRIKFT